MSVFQRDSLQKWSEQLERQNIHLPLSEHTQVLNQPITVGEKTIPNRIAIQPMEGCDGTQEGIPAEPTIRRYHRFAQSGAGLIWLEAVAVCEEGRANPRQLWMKKENQSAFQKLVWEIKEQAVKSHGYEPVVIMQATHSGRYAKPNGVPEPLIAYHNPLFEQTPISDSAVVSDDYLKRLEEIMGQAAAMAEQAGFDGVDLKSCHRYLGSELLSAYIRPGEYGGSFENRTRFLKNSVKAARQMTGSGFLVTSRLNVYDGFPYPYGFGVSSHGGTEPDLTEPIQLVGELHEQLGMPLIDITIGNPYVNPHVNRPANHYPYACEESPLYGVERMIRCVSAIQKAFPNLAVISSGMSYVKEMGAYLAAGGVEQGCFSIAGFGRQAFAYPQFAHDILSRGEMDAKQCCVACGKCSELMRAGSIAGCVIRDGAYYLPYYQKDVLGRKE